LAIAAEQQLAPGTVPPDFEENSDRSGRKDDGSVLQSQDNNKENVTSAMIEVLCCHSIHSQHHQQAKCHQQI
jgi:hypothetical protein